MSKSIKILHLTNDQIDKKRWDQTMEDSLNGIVFGYSWYLDVTFPNWEALVSEDYSYIFPLTIRKKLRISYWYSPIYTMQLGLFSIHKLTEENIRLFYSEFPNNISSYDFSVNKEIQYIPTHFKITNNKCQYVDLSLTYSEIYNGYSSNLKRNLKKANVSNLFMEESTDIKSVVTMFRTYRGELIKNVSESDYNALYQLINNALKEDAGKVYHVYHNKQLLASCFFSFTNNRIIYHKGGVNEDGKKLGAMHYLIDQLIQQNSSTNQTFDFGGSSIDAVRRFNQNFGKQEYTYFQLQKGSTVVTRLRKWKNKLFKS